MATSTHSDSASSACSSASPIATPPLAADEIKAKIRADEAVVSNLKELETSFGCMIVTVKCHLEKCDLSNAKLFLLAVIGTKAFDRCKNFGEILELLLQEYVDVFNICILQQLLTYCEQTEIIKSYNETKEKFLQQTTVLEFQRAVVSRVEPILASGKAVVTIVISRQMAYDRTLKDIEKLALEGFDECHKEFIHLHAEPGSAIISWVFPERISGRLKELAHKNAHFFKNAGVEKLTVGEMIVFSCNQQKVRAIANPICK